MFDILTGDHVWHDVETSMVLSVWPTWSAIGEYSRASHAGNQSLKQDSTNAYANSWTTYTAIIDCITYVDVEKQEMPKKQWLYKQQMQTP